MVKHIDVTGKNLTIVEVSNGGLNYAVYIQNGDVTVMPCGKSSEFYTNTENEMIKGVIIFK